MPRLLDTNMDAFLAKRPSTRFGFALIVGRPLRPTLLRWFASGVAWTPGIKWVPHETIHGTIVNCSRPCARSVTTEEEALKHAQEIKNSALQVLVPCLNVFDAVNIEFESMRIASRDVILPSLPSAQIGTIKQALQGGRDYVATERVASVLAATGVFGVDKFSTECGSLQPTIKLTLGNADGDASKIILPRTRTPPPGLTVRGFRLVFYRDRMLNNAVASDELRLDRSGTYQADNESRIRRFFDHL